MRRNTTSIIFAIILMLTALACNHEGVLRFEDWDKNNSGKIEKQEFVDTFTLNYYDDWDRKDDGYLDDEDFFQIYYDVMNRDDDDGVSEEEFSWAYEYYNRGEFRDEYENWDVNDDFILTYEEYQAGLYESTFFRLWDFNDDGKLSEEELATGMFRVFDINDDGMVDRDEYDTYKDYYLEI